MTGPTYHHWRIEIDQHRILWLTFDREGASVNSMNRDVFSELEQIIVDIAKENPEGVVILSGKKKGFIAGADITQFTALQTTDEAFHLIRQAQLVLDQLEALKMPTVAMIQGFCLGGGLEVALACRYLLAADTDDTILGLPEVKLGIHPGWGGTVRLPRRIGALQAMGLMLPGSTVSARKALKLGIVDCALPARDLKRAAIDYCLRKPKPLLPKGIHYYSNASLVRPWLGKWFRKKLKEKVNEAHYPAPFAIINNWVTYGVSSAAFLAEAKSIAELMITDTSRNLVRAFFLREQLKSAAKVSKRKISRVHVIGAGTMGGDIAAWCALQGMSVTLQDQSPERIAPAIKRAYALFDKKLKLPHKIQAVMDRLIPDVAGMGLKNADLIIEAIFENLSAKQELFQSIEKSAKPDAILATNTSSIPLDAINVVLKQKERLVGIHYFNPVAKMPLVEVACGEFTAPDTVDDTMAFVNRIGKLPLRVKSTPGFLINRLLMPYLLEAMLLMAEGASVTEIDQAAMDFGMPVGPIALSDQVGLDICLSVADNLIQHYGGTIPDTLRQLVQAGDLGVKTGRGFYQYQHGKALVKQSTSAARHFPDITNRLIFRILNEAVLVLQEQVVANADFLDAGMIYGTGFAPFRGGPITYAKKIGIDAVIETLNQLARQYGDRFLPHSGWNQLLASQGDSHEAHSI